MFLMDLQSYATILHHAAILFLEYFIFFSKSPHALLLSVTSSMWSSERHSEDALPASVDLPSVTVSHKGNFNTWSLVPGSLTCFHALSFIRTRVHSPKNPPLRDSIIFLYS